MTETEGDTYARVPVPDAVLEMYSGEAGQPASCATLTPMIKSSLRELQGGQILEVRVDDPSALVDVPSWSRLAGHELIATVEDEDDPRRIHFYLRKRMG
jgi:TusA-related sulfurtransferase